MFGFIVTILVGAGIALFGPTVLPLRNWVGDALATLGGLVLRIVGVLIMVFAVLSTSFVFVPDGHVGHMFRWYGGGALEKGRIIATNEENGPQARILQPGFQKELMMNIFYDVDTNKKDTLVPAGKVGVLAARDGAPLRAGQVFADPINLDMLDAVKFLTNGGQKGPQITVLTPGVYRLNRYLWDVSIMDAVEIQQGYVGVVKSNIHADVDFGQLKAKKPDRCDVMKQSIAEGTNADKVIDAPRVPMGCIGVWKEVLQPGKYNLNPSVFHVTPMDTKAQVWIYAGGHDRADITLSIDGAGEITQKRSSQAVKFDSTVHADTAVIVRMEGWDVPLELRVIAQVSPEDASCVISGVGGLREVEDRVLTPSIRAIARDVAGGTYTITEAKLDENGKPILDKEGKPVIVTVTRPTKVLDLINQRPLIEGEIERRIQPEARNACVTIREVRLGEPAIPPELLLAVRRQQLAGQLQSAYKEEKLAQDQRVTSEKARATANQQGELVRAEIQEQASLAAARTARNQGQGERDRLAFVAEGQKLQQTVLGVDATVQLRKFELLVERVGGFFEKHPEVLTTALSNPQKFVPTVVGGNGSGGGLVDSLLGMIAADRAGQATPQQRPQAGGAR